MLINNISTNDSLVNGTFGTLEDIGLKLVKAGVHKVNHMIIKFDNLRSGKKQRERHPIESDPYKLVNGTPIFRQGRLKIWMEQSKLIFLNMKLTEILKP